MRCQKLFLANIIILSLFSLVLFASSVFAADCWQYGTPQTNSSCTAVNGCIWKEDTWGSWCETLSCWSFRNQNECASSSIPGKNCTWSGEKTTYYCAEISCYSFGGTSEATCENNSLGKTCDWGNTCYSNGVGIDCWMNTNETACRTSTGCKWGTCYDKGCWSYTDSTTCQRGKDWRGNNCTWDQSINYCKEKNCWDTAIFANQTSCNAATKATNGINCEWKYNSCQDKGCWSFDFTNQTACESNSINLSCTWDSAGYCYQSTCWNYNAQATCLAKTQCSWENITSSGYCNEVNCWSWDSLNQGSESACEGNASFYGLSCSWRNMSSTSNGYGWCEKDYTGVNCTNITVERTCMDTFYCWWQSNDWNNATSGGTCNEPQWGAGSYTNVTAIMIEWNPGCYVFDRNSTDCNNILGCNFTNGKCEELTNDYGLNITATGINCTYINSSSLCNNIPVLSTCCSWGSGVCTANRYSTGCTKDLSQTPNGEKSCEEAKSQTACDNLAGTPWYMPCKWDNTTSIQTCQFQAYDIFGNTSYSIVKIDNQKNCEAAGGKWITENYCEGNVSVPTGRCEYKFDDEENCDKACFACEKKDSNGIAINTSNARSACIGSRLGFCNFTASSIAPNGIGYCQAKDEWKKGIAVGCDSNCGDCTYLGDPKNNDTTKKPSSYCTNSKANTLNGGCKWITDNTTTTGGYCVGKESKTCEDACDRCTTQITCNSLGRTSLANVSGSCKWQGTSTDGSCVTNIAGDVEVCWDGIDNNDDGTIDCADPSCYADSYCGFVSGNCFGWADNGTCAANGCEWLTDNWGAWCDFKGSQCWKLNANQANCTSNGYCKWNAGTGNGWCERDWSLNEACMHLDKGNCTGNCVWENDDWCDSGGNTSEWCRNYGGWCNNEDFAPKNCWQQTTSSQCNGVSGCAWQTDTYSQSSCEANYSANCWNYTSSNTCSNAGCKWFTNNWGSWCATITEQCSYQANQTSCEAITGGTCRWEVTNWGSWCTTACWNLNLTESSCQNLAGCMWRADRGWCSEQQAASCYNTSASTQAGCEVIDGCKWKSPGWCDPKDGGFSGAAMAVGVGGGKGGDCYKYDGNQSYCTNKSKINISCGWFAEPYPSCQPDWSKDCWRYSAPVNGCNLTNGCWFKNDSFGTMCMNLMEECWINETLKNNQTLCNDHPYCNATDWGGCESACTKKTGSATCLATTGCRWVTGYCNPAGMNDMFDNMESGSPMPLGVDPCGTEGISQKSVDICGFGLRDMGDSYGFGIMVNDFSNSSTCNKQKLSSFVMGMVGGNMTGGGSAPGGAFGTERIGAGNETVEIFVYLDTDGSITGGCPLSHNTTTTEGYEFRLRYHSQWNATIGTTVETFTAYKCDNNEWKTTDIKVNAWKKLMCSDIGGAMIAIEKADLARFPTLYDATKDMRIFVATAGSNNNVTTPTDTASPGWMSPGSIDFELFDVFAYGADIAKYEDILKKGFVGYEDCFNLIDDDNDGNIDCNDWDCQYSSKCATTGINAAGYTDTKSAQITGIKVEEYPDSALILYDSNKPTNGTLLFYLNDTKCLTLNSTINDTGLFSSYIRDFKPWHSASIYNDTGIYSLKYPLVADTKYYYKLKICDSVGKCSLSKCSSFMTSSTAKCAYCNFVTRIKTPTGWKVAYDTDQDGIYEHVQGSVCGTNAGMKTTYNDGRSVNILLNKTDGTAYLEFINATLTKTGLNDKARTISTAGSIVYNNTVTDSSGDTIGYVGLLSQTRDKIINNLHPEICRLKIPKGETDCTHLWHCDDNGANCTEKTSSATALTAPDTSSCLWQIPYCEFSVWASGRPGTSSSSSSSSSSSGGGSSGGSGTSLNETIRISRLIPSITPEEPAIVAINNNVLKVKEITLNVNVAVNRVKLIIQHENVMPTSVLQDIEGKSVYRYMTITTENLLAGNLDSGKIVFVVDKSWLTENNLDKEKVVMMRYTTEWEELPTTKVSELVSQIKYEATTPGFSVFAIATEALPTATEEFEEEATGEAVVESEEVTVENKPINKGIIIAVLAGAGILLIIIGVIIIIKKKITAAKGSTKTKQKPQ